MYISKHAELRLMERSSLQQVEVENILSNGAYVLLGTVGIAIGMKAFALFYSPTDERCFIAILSHNRLGVISILPDTYTVPAHMQQVTPEVLELAKERYLNFVSRSYASSVDTPVVVTLYVQHRYESVPCSLGEFPAALAVAKLPAIVTAIAPQLRSVVEAMHDADLSGPIRYTILFRTREGETITKHTIRHNKRLRKQLKRTT